MTALTDSYVVRIDKTHTMTIPLSFFIKLDRAARGMGFKDGRVALREAAQEVDWSSSGSKSAMIRARAAERLGLTH